MPGQGRKGEMRGAGSALSAAVSHEIDAGASYMPNERQPGTVRANRALKRAPMSPTEKVSWRDGNVLKLLKVLLLL